MLRVQGLRAELGGLALSELSLPFHSFVLLGLDVTADFLVEQESMINLCCFCLYAAALAFYR